MLPVGEIIQDRYQVEALLGSGGLADVYRVRHLALGSLHALKVLSWDRASVDRRLLLEGRIQAQLRHPNIVAVTDVLRVEGKAALLLDYVDGPTMEDYLDQLESPLELDQAMELFAGILAAVVRAHDAGVLHRDLKPQNVLLATQGDRLQAKVTDFGLAKVVQDEMEAGNTRTNVTMGTPGYMAPEQVRDAASVDARTDVFALAVLLHELLTGRRAFVDEEGYTAVTATLELTAAPLPDTVPTQVREAVEAALSRDPDGRPADARAFAETLFAEGDPRRRDVLALGGTPLALSPRREQVATLNSLQEGKSSTPSTDGSAETAQAPTAVPLTDPGPAPSRRGPLGAVLVAVVLLGALAVGGVSAAGLWVVLGTDDAPADPLVDGNRDPASRGPAPSGTPTNPASRGPAPSGTPTNPASTGPAPSGVPTDPAVPAPVPEPAEPEPVDPEPAAVPEPVAAGTADPEPAPVTPEPTEPEPPAPEPVAPAVAPEPTPAPSGTDEPDPEAELEAKMAEMQRLLSGSWTGSTDRGQPLVLRIDSVDLDGVRGALVFTGPTSRTIDLSGSYDNGALSMSSSDGTQVQGKVSGGKVTGTYGKGKRSIPFTAAR